MAKETKNAEVKEEKKDDSVKSEKQVKAQEEPKKASVAYKVVGKPLATNGGVICDGQLVIETHIPGGKEVIDRLVKAGRLNKIA